jgi:cytoskeletal protein RodZ
MRTKREINNKKKSVVIILIIILVILAAALGIFILNRNNEPETTSKSPTAQSNYNSGGNHQNSSSGNVTQGGATDNNGKATNQSTSQSQWKTSDSGVIILKEPITPAVIKNGDEFSGVATNLDKIEYRLVDNAAGVIAQGELNVVNDNFSGNLQFQTKGGLGRLDVYSYDSQGREINSVELTVTLQ